MKNQLFILSFLATSYVTHAQSLTWCPRQYGEHTFFMDVSTGNFVFYDTTHQFTDSLVGKVMDSPMIEAMPFVGEMAMVVYQTPFGPTQVVINKKQEIVGETDYPDGFALHEQYPGAGWPAYQDENALFSRGGYAFFAGKKMCRGAGGLVDEQRKIYFVHDGEDRVHLVDAKGDVLKGPFTQLVWEKHEKTGRLVYYVETAKEKSFLNENLEPIVTVAAKDELYAPENFGRDSLVMAVIENGSIRFLSYTGKPIDVKKLSACFDAYYCMLDNGWFIPKLYGFNHLEWSKLLFDENNHLVKKVDAVSRHFGIYSTTLANNTEQVKSYDGRFKMLEGKYDHVVFNEVFFAAKKKGLWSFFDETTGKMVLRGFDGKFMHKEEPDHLPFYTESNDTTEFLQMLSPSGEVLPDRLYEKRAYGDVGYFYGGYWDYAQKNGKRLLIDKQGRPMETDGQTEWELALGMDLMYAKKDGKYGFFTSDQKALTGFVFDSVFVVQNIEPYIVVVENGKRKIFDPARPAVREDFSGVKSIMRINSKDLQYLVVLNATGAKALISKTSLQPMTGFEFGCANGDWGTLYEDNFHLMILSKNCLLGALDVTGKTVVPFEYTRLQGLVEGSGILLGEKDGHSFYTDLQGHAWMLK